MAHTDTAPIEHQSVFGGGHQDWRLGNTCSECETLVAETRAGTSGGRGLLQYGIKRWQGVDYMSSQEQEKQVVASARSRGIEPERYAPNEHYKDV